MFKSDGGERDTILIVKKEVFYPEYTPVEVHEKYLPQTGLIIYSNKKIDSIQYGNELVYIVKTKPSNGTRLFINFLGANINILNLTEQTVQGMKTGKLYEFDTFKPNGKLYEPKKIFWHEKYGIIKYVTHDNTVWDRNNIN